MARGDQRALRARRRSGARGVAGQSTRGDRAARGRVRGDQAMARSIIIEDIKPTHWRLRLRDGAGKSREVDFKSGTPLRLDMGEKVAAIDSAAKKSHKPSKPEARAKAKEPTRTADKSRKSEEAAEEEKPKATRGDSEAAPKPASESASKPRPRKPEPGAGPGELVWEENEDDGVPGLRASFERGAFKILHAGGDVFALFYEWNNGKYQTLACGPLE